MLPVPERMDAQKGSCDEVDYRPGRFATAAPPVGGKARHSRKSSYSFVTIRKLLTRCGARMPLTAAEYRRVVVSRSVHWFRSSERCPSRFRPSRAAPGGPRKL